MSEYSNPEHPYQLTLQEQETLGELQQQIETDRHESESNQHYTEAALGVTNKGTFVSVEEGLDPAASDYFSVRIGHIAEITHGTVPEKELLTFTPPAAGEDAESTVVRSSHGTVVIPSAKQRAQGELPFFRANSLAGEQAEKEIIHSIEESSFDAPTGTSIASSEQEPPKQNIDQELRAATAELELNKLMTALVAVAESSTDAIRRNGEPAVFPDTIRGRYDDIGIARHLIPNSVAFVYSRSTNTYLKLAMKEGSDDEEMAISISTATPLRRGLRKAADPIFGRYAEASISYDPKTHRADDMNEGIMLERDTIPNKDLVDSYQALAAMITTAGPSSREDFDKARGKAIMARFDKHETHTDEFGLEVGRVSLLEDVGFAPKFGRKRKS